MYSIGQLVTVKCPVYKNGRKLTGKVKLIHKDYCMIIIDGNKKSTQFANIWITPLQKPHFSELTKKLFNL